VLDECIRAGEELETQAEIVENTGGYGEKWSRVVDGVS
jgi:hypothetical protein